MVPRLLEVGFSLFSKRRKLYGHRAWALSHDTLLRILRMTAWRPDWGRASGVSKAWHAVIANDVCYRAIRQRWIEDHDEDLQSMLRLIAAEERRKKEKLREGRPGSSDTE